MSLAWLVEHSFGHEKYDNRPYRERQFICLSIEAAVKKANELSEKYPDCRAGKFAVDSITSNPGVKQSFASGEWLEITCLEALE